MSYKKINIIYAIAALCVLLIGVTAAFFAVRHFTASPIPQGVIRQIDFAVMYPKSSKDVSFDRNSIKYDPETKVLSFIVITYGISSTFTEQATPDPFTDIPNYYQTFADKMNSYRSFDTYNGRVDITRPTTLKGDQALLMNAKGTLLFAHPTRDLNEQQWRALINSLQIQKQD